MRVLFVGSHRADRQFSIVGFEQALQRELVGRCDFEVVYPGRLRSVSSGSKWTRYVDKYVLFPSELRRRAKSADLVHFSEKGLAVNLRHVKGRPRLVTLHDLLAFRAAQDEFPGWKVGFSGRRYQDVIVRALATADAFAFVSETTRSEVGRRIPGFPGEVRTILNGMYKSFSRLPQDEAARRVGNLNGPFFFHIGGNKPYKNRAGALTLFAETKRQCPKLPLRLVMAGGPRTSELESLERRLAIGSQVTWVVEPTDAQVEAYYSLSTALLFPSFAEGFGLPIIEAQSCGCPVFATGRAPMTEVGGSSAVYFDCEDVVGSATQVLHHLDDLEAMTTAGTENVKRFGSKVMADAYLQYYRDLTGVSGQRTATRPI